MSGRFNQSSRLVLATSAANPLLPAAAPNQLDGTVSVGAAIGTVPIWVKDLDAWGLSFSTPAGSTLVGTLTVQATCDRGMTEQTGAPDATLVNWQTIAVLDKTSTTPGTLVASKAIASGANVLLIEDMTVAYRWVRFLMAYTSGSGLVTASFQQKGSP